MVAFATEQAELLIHGASLNIVTEYCPQPHSFSLFGAENDDFIQIKGVSPGIYLPQQAVVIMTADPSVLQEASSLDESCSLDWQFSFFGMKNWHTGFTVVLIMQ